MPPAESQHGEQAEIRLQTQLVAPAILQISRDKQTSQRHGNQAQHNSRKQRFNHGSISLTLSQILATNG